MQRPWRSLRSLGALVFKQYFTFFFSTLSVSLNTDAGSADYLVGLSGAIVQYVNKDIDLPTSISRRRVSSAISQKMSPVAAG